MAGQHPETMILPSVWVHLVKYPDHLITNKVRESSKQRNRDKKEYTETKIKEILSEYVNILPEEIKIEVTPSGKPYLLHHEQTLRFNYSHSGEYLAVAVSNTAKTGIDIEFVRHFSQMMDVVKRVSSDTFHFLNDHCFTEDDKTNAFFKFWTSNEAMQKCRGMLMPDLFIPYQMILEESGSVDYHGKTINYQRIQALDHYSICIASEMKDE